MRGSLSILILMSGVAFADRSTALSIGLTGDARATGATFNAAGNSDQLDKLAGLRATVTFEDAPLPFPAPGEVATEARLVPELFTGFLADDVKAEGYVGAGLRAELQLASHRRDVPMRTVIYAAARAIVIDKHQDGATEFVIGEYLSLSHGRRFGWEGGAMMRPKTNDGQHELDALLSIYVGWR